MTTNNDKQEQNLLDRGLRLPPYESTTGQALYDLSRGLAAMTATAQPLGASA